jgi:ABC-type branched-subunit amino acid transport system substrate-binding protein
MLKGNLSFRGNAFPTIAPCHSMVWQAIRGQTVVFDGNDYIWPKGINAQAAVSIADSGGQVVGEQYVSFDFDDFNAVI